MASLVYIKPAEEALVGFVSTLLNSWPEYLRTVLTTMRRTVTEAASKVPEALKSKAQQLTKVEKEIDNLVAALADGSLDSPAVKKRLAASECLAEELRQDVAQLVRAQAAPVTMPDDAWVRNQLPDLVSILNEDKHQAAILVRKLLGRVHAHAILPPGKKRGYVRLRFRVNYWEVVRALVGDKVSEGLIDNLVAGTESFSPQFNLDLGGPTRMDELGAKIAAMRKDGVPWKQIWQETGLKSGPAYVAWKRWVNAHPSDEPAA